MENQPGNNPQKWSFEAFLRKTFKPLLNNIAGFLDKLGITPNMITVFGLVVAAGSGVLLGYGKITAGGLVLLIGAPMDSMDGALARLKGEPKKYGAFLDSVVDRVAEMFTLGGLLVFYALKADTLALVLVFIAAAGSLLVSYVKARAESLGYNAKMGLMTRVERMVVLIPCLIFNIPMVGLWILAVGTVFTALQRFFFVRKQAIQE